MATVEAVSYKDPAWTSGAPGAIITRVSKAEDFSFTTVAGDIVKFFKLPPNAKILNGGVFGEDIDAAATIELQVTDGTTTYKLLDAADVSTGAYSHDALSKAGAVATGAIVTGGVLMASWLGKVTDDDDWYVCVYVDDAPTAAATDVNMQCYISYTMDLEVGQST